MSAKILVLGGNGKTGKRVTERLKNLKINYRAVSRSTSPPFDWDDAGTWEHALADMQTVYITFQPDLAIPEASERIASFVTHAKQAGIKKLVLLSGRGEEGAQKCETIIKKSGLDWTIVRASWFMQNFSESFFLDSVLAGHLIVPKVKAREPFIDADDIADVVVEALTKDGHNQQVHELTGPELIDFKKITELFSRYLPQKVGLEEISIEEYVDLLRSYGLPPDFIWLINHLFVEVLDGRNESLTTDVEDILGRKPVSFEAFIQKTLSEGIWDQSVNSTQ